jgi:hypothetical protein
MSNYPPDADPYPAGTPGQPAPGYPGSGAPTGPPPGAPPGYPVGQPTSQFPDAGHDQWSGGHGSPYPDHHTSRRNLNVKSALKTTEFWVLVVVSIALLVAAAVTDQGDDGQGFGAQDAWRFITILGAAYMISRGLTKFGGREERDDDSSRTR